MIIFTISNRGVKTTISEPMPTEWYFFELYEKYIAGLFTKEKAKKKK